MNDLAESRISESNKVSHEINLPLSQFRLQFQGSLGARGYAGSAWRGAFGHALKRTVCVTHLRDCQTCMLYCSCAYPYVFETPPPADAAKMRKYRAAPHPFVLETPIPADPDAAAETSELGLVLFGNAARYLPYLIYALQRAGAEGIGQGRMPLRLRTVLQAGQRAAVWEAIYQADAPLRPLPSAIPRPPPLPDSVTLRILTPLRIRRQEILVSPEAFTFADLFNVLLRRMSMLTYFHTDTPLEVDFRTLVAASRAIPVVSANLRWYDWTRYSSRQRTTMQMGGILGDLELPAERLAPFWPYLWLGQWTHAGKGASMGLGQYAIESASLRAPTGPAS